MAGGQTRAGKSDRNPFFAVPADEPLPVGLVLIASVALAAFILGGLVFISTAAGVQ